MTCNALEHATDVLVYLSGLRNQSVFNFCAIPQAMAIATLALVFRNPQVFQRNVKIRKGQACSIINRSTNLKYVGEMFIEHIRILHAKNHPSDPNFLRVSELCGRIEQWIMTVFPPLKITPAQQLQQARGEKPLDPAKQAQIDRDMKLVVYSVVGFWVFMGGLLLFVAWLLGARYDLAWQDLLARAPKVDSI